MAKRTARTSHRSIRRDDERSIRRCCVRRKSAARGKNSEPMIFASVDGKDQPEIPFFRTTVRQALAHTLLSLISASSPAASAEWRRYTIPETGLGVDVPVTIFTEDAGPPEGAAGRSYFTADRRADLTIKSIPILGMIYQPRFLKRCSRRPAYSTDGSLLDFSPYPASRTAAPGTIAAIAPAAYELRVAELSDGGRSSMGRHCDADQFITGLS